MSRPLKEEEERRSKVLPPCRVTDSERAMIKAKAAQAGMTLSEFQRQCCLEAVVVMREPLADKQLIKEMLSIGRNLNQLTKKAHIFEEVDASVLRLVLRKIDDLLDKLIT